MLQKPVVREFNSASTPQPEIAILGTAPFTTLITNAGGGQTRYGPLALNRWRRDSTLDDFGQWCYVKDLTNGRLWSATYQPVCARPSWYRARFENERAVFHRRDGEVETRMEVVVSSENMAEIRRITVFNRSSEPREIELTSYSEIVIAPMSADRGHPAFANLFVQTEWIAGSSSVLAMRRPRSATSKPIWCGHTLSVRTDESHTSCETDRAGFLGRGRSGRDPVAMDRDGELSGRVGAVLDPIFAIRTRVSIAPGASAEAVFTTFVAEDRDEAVRLADLYHDPSRVADALELSLVEATGELRVSGMTPDEASLNQQLAAHLLFPQFRSIRPLHEARRNALRQPDLRAVGISGAVPVVVATIDSSDGLPTVRALLKLHRYWAHKGVNADLVILNSGADLSGLSDEFPPEPEVPDESENVDSQGRVVVRRSSLLHPEDLALLHSIARIHVKCYGTGLETVLNSLRLREEKDQEPQPQWANRIKSRDDAMVNGPSGNPDPASELQYFNGIGGFNGSNEYEIRLNGTELPPAPWINVIANANGGFTASETGGGSVWAISSSSFRITPWQNDPVRDRPGECIYIRDDETGRVWTPTPAPIRERSPYIVRHGAGYSTFDHVHDDVATSLRIGVPEEDPLKLQVLTFTNNGARSRRLTIVSYAEWVLGTDRETTLPRVRTSLDPATGVMLAANRFNSEFAPIVAFAAMSETLSSYTDSRREFVGRNGSLSAPDGLMRSRLSGEVGNAADPCAALAVKIQLAPGETKAIAIVLGAAEGSEQATAMAGRYRTPELADAALDATILAWRSRLGTIVVRTPEPAFDLMVNQWALYQALSCRVWGRTALYQSSGAFGFRDQLQDVMACTYADPALAREQIVRAASRQFEEGDVQHWWHPHSGRGVRTRFADDLIWLPFVIDHYLRVTCDTSVLDEQTPYLRMRTLKPDEDELYAVPGSSDITASVFDHCVHALNHACTKGAHGLPLMKSGDWNDGMNRVGIDGKGESVWLAWFLIRTLRSFEVHAQARGYTETAADFRSKADNYSKAAEKSAWDGEWYRRAYYDDGAPLGSHVNEECQIDSIAQSWSVISGAGSAERRSIAMESLNKRLVREDARLIMLLTPSFDRGTRDPGYIQGYLPGVRENGAQYTHAALWAVLATALQGDGNRAMELYQMINPITHALTAEDVATYKVEPYVVAADVYTAEGHVGRGGWTWYTGSASWLYRVGLEAILGFTKRGNELEIDPCIPASWKEFSIEYRFGESTYSILIANAAGAQKGVASVLLDGAECGGRIPLISDGRTHEVTVTLGIPP